MHDFQFLVNGKLNKYTRWEDIPEEFDHIIKFVFDIPPEPHTQEDHDEIHRMEQRFHELMEKENARSMQNRRR
jgi:hypothetical protein